MQATFVELPTFSRHRETYLDDEGFRDLQHFLLTNPEAGELIPGTGGLRKIRHLDPRRHKGKRGGLRIIYFWWPTQQQFWMMTLYNKNEATDLSPTQRAALKALLERELEARS